MNKGHSPDYLGDVLGSFSNEQTETLTELLECMYEQMKQVNHE